MTAAMTTTPMLTELQDTLSRNPYAIAAIRAANLDQKSPAFLVDRPQVLESIITDAANYWPGDTVFEIVGADSLANVQPPRLPPNCKLLRDSKAITRYILHR